MQSRDDSAAKKIHNKVEEDSSTLLWIFFYFAGEDTPSKHHKHETQGKHSKGGSS